MTTAMSDMTAAPAVAVVDVSVSTRIAVGINATPSTNGTSSMSEVAAVTADAEVAATEREGARSNASTTTEKTARHADATTKAAAIEVPEGVGSETARTEAAITEATGTDSTPSSTNSSAATSSLGRVDDHRTAKHRRYRDDEKFFPLHASFLLC